MVNQKHASAADERVSSTPSMMKESLATVFQVEEACHEAILGTGASIGHSLGPNVWPNWLKLVVWEIPSKRPPSNVNFRFGNSGVLQRSHAAFFPRKIGGWIRVEVVPGQTPFLLSNSVLRALRAVVDVEAKQVWFKGTNTSIPLKTCRKNLMSVDFSQILNLSMDHTVGHQH